MGSWKIIPPIAIAGFTAGQVVDFETDLGFLIDGQVGTGAPEMAHNTTPYALASGSLYQGARAAQRIFGLRGKLVKTPTKTVAQLRDTLSAVLNPFAYGADQPLKIRYTGNAQDREVEAYYSGGMEVAGFMGGQSAEELILRFLAPDPFPTKTSDSVNSSLGYQSALTVAGLITKVNGEWQDIEPATNPPGTVYALLELADGKILIGGNFTNVNSVADADCLVTYDPATDAWAAVGTGTAGVAGGVVYALYQAPNGDIYIGGTFTSVDGVSAAKLAKWNGTAWSQVGAVDPNGTVRAITMGEDGTLYIGGGFTAVGAVSANYVAKWNGTAWSALSTGLTSGVGYTVYCLERRPGGGCYIGGIIKSPSWGGAGEDYVAEWDGTTLTGMGSGFNSYPWTMTTAPDGRLYAAGNFTTDKATGTFSLQRIARWNGADWEGVHAGTLSGMIKGIAFEGNILHFAGVHDSINPDFVTDGIYDFKYGIIDGAGIRAGTVDFYSVINNRNIEALLVTSDGDVYLGDSGAGAADSVRAPAYGNIVNSGTHRAYPIITITGTATSYLGNRIRDIVNLTTGKKLVLNYLIREGEVLTIDLRPNHRSMTSSIYGSRWRTLPGSDVADFYLAPKTNRIGLRATGAVSISFTWRETYLGFI